MQFIQSLYRRNCILKNSIHTGKIKSINACSSPFNLKQQQNNISRIFAKLLSDGVIASVSTQNISKESAKSGPVGVLMSHCFTFSYMFTRLLLAYKERLSCHKASPASQWCRELTGRQSCLLFQTLLFSACSCCDALFLEGNHIVSCGVILHCCIVIINMTTIHCHLCKFSLLRLLSWSWVLDPEIYDIFFIFSFFVSLHAFVISIPLRVYSV